MLVVIALVAAITFGVTLTKAKPASAGGYCSTWEWITNGRWCSYWVICGPVFSYWDGTGWIILDYCGHRYY